MWERNNRMFIHEVNVGPSDDRDNDDGELNVQCPNCDFRVSDRSDIMSYFLVHF